MLPVIVNHLHNNTPMPINKNTLKKILVVDDDKDILDVVKLILTRSGFDVYTHSTGIDVANTVSNNHPNLVLLDIGLPGKLGTEVCKELKKIFSIPVIFFSAHADQRKTMQEYNADGFIQKPFNVADLIAYIKSYLP
jgi:DNA-binding response OmpR family regulator